MAAPDPHVEAFCRQYGEQDPVALILRFCRELLARNPTEKGRTPINVLASCQNIRHIDTGALGSNSSMLFEHDGGFRVILNESDPPERQLFSLAHEIIHTFFREIPGYTTTHDSHDVEELCNIGAAELTMPAGRFLAVLGEAGGATLKGLKACKDEFGTSLQACARRAADLVEEPITIVVADAVTGLNNATRVRLADLQIAKVYRSARSRRENDPSLIDLRENPAVAKTFETLTEHAGVLDAHKDGGSIGRKIEAIAYDFSPDGVPCRRVVVLIAPSD